MWRAPWPGAGGGGVAAGASSKARLRRNPRGVGPVTCMVSRVNKTFFPGSGFGSVRVKRARARSQCLLSAQAAEQARQVTNPVAVACVPAHVDQCRCFANSPSSAQVSTMLRGRMRAGPWPQTRTAGVAGRDRAAAVPAAAGEAAAGPPATTAISAAPARIHDRDNLCMPDMPPWVEYGNGRLWPPDMSLCLS